MAAEAGVIFNLQILVMLQHIGLVVVVTFVAADGTAFAFLNPGMAGPAGNGLIVICGLLMTGCTVTTVKFLELRVFELFRVHLVVVAFGTGDGLFGPVEIVMAGGTGLNGLIVRAMVKKDVARAAFQIEPVRYHRFVPGHAADSCSGCSDTQGNGQ